ncbi:OTU-like cysteine protease [Moesziomyces antarcticus T-34]|uniref:Ubiquitin thioesterase OTU n=1 Tax=Pseudozyma antarctica (strain T-34) TaxID=1151754 RepID=M9MHP0_PSEA3|nr:OTU-like cysteine protease [Moesziomyces antarcticus T-34]
MIRIRHPEGTSSFALDDSITLSALQAYIQAESGIAPADQELKIGYPPKPLALAALGGDTPLSSDVVGIRKGEQVIVARRAASGAATAASAGASGSAATSSFGRMGGPQPIVSTATGPRSYGLGARTLNDGLTARTPGTSASSRSSTPSNSKVTDGSVSVPLSSGQGYLALKVVPDDNSCLFNSIGFLFEQRLGADICSGLRSTVADAIRSNPSTYPDIVLGQPREAYISKILNPQTWGGAIELSILAEHFGVELTSVDVASGTIHRFGEDKNFENRGIVIYSGIHYDAVALIDRPGASLDRGTTVFPNLSAVGVEVDEDPVLAAAKQLAQQLKQRRYYTDTASFSLRCKTCGTKLTGEKHAVEHAKSTGHGDFGEV